MNNSLTQMMINYAPLLILFVVGWFFGTRHERQHLGRLSVAEKELSHISSQVSVFIAPSYKRIVKASLCLAAWSSRKTTSKWSSPKC